MREMTISSDECVDTDHKVASLDSECKVDASPTAELETTIAELKRTTAERQAKAPSPWLLPSFVLLGLLGIAVSVELTRIHVFVHTDPDYHSVCAMSEGVNCETVAVSPYSVFAGLPVAVWGIAGYLAMTILALWGGVKGRLHQTWPLGLLLVLTAFSVATSAVLAFLSVASIGSFCLFCMASYAVNAALFSLAVAAWKQTHVRLSEVLLSDVQELRARPRIPVALGLLGGAVLGCLYGFVPNYWQSPGWADLPKLASGMDQDGHHWIGARDPKITIVEFSDYQCPHCRAAHKDVRSLAAKYPDRIRLIHRHLPLDMACHPALRRPFHTQACLFAEAAECAGLQGKFWEMNDALFSIQDTVKAVNVDPGELAVRLGLNRVEFKHCLETHVTAKRVDADLRVAMDRKLNGTPSFLIGDRLYLGRLLGKDLEEILQDEVP